MLSMKTLVLLLFNAVTLSLAKAEDELVVTLPDGQIRGHTLRSPKGNEFYAFQEIPYAAPPVGELRFQAPTVPQKWNGVLNTTQNRNICYQGKDFQELPDTVQTEDCLYLNVYTPQMPGASPDTLLPVLVWIHGGRFTRGTGAIQFYKPGYFIDNEIIVVTINYRLGPLGFLTTEDGVIPGNIGLKDQHLALQWVKKNINLFRGDPEKITIDGESAGGKSVGFHLVSKRNKGLFRAAILQSGTALCQTAHQDYARFYAFELGRSLDPNFNSTDSKELLKLLQNLPASDISNNSITPAVGKETGIVEAEGFIWLPVIEDENLEGAFLTSPFQEDFKIGSINQVPILIGFNSEESLYFLTSVGPSVERRALLWDSDVSSLIRNKFNMTQANKVIAGTKLRQIYTEGLFENDLEAAVKFSSDELIATPTTRHAKLQSLYTDVFLYQFSYKGKMGGLIDAEVAGVRGVTHSEELYYLWKDPTPEDDSEDLVTRNRLITLWANFVKYINPTPEKDSLLGNLTWEKVAPNSLVYLNINKTLEMKRNPKEYLKWERIIDVYAIPPLVNY